MVTVLVLSGGQGSRIGGAVPKQYILVCGRPIIMHCLEMIERRLEIDAAVVVAEKKWQDVISIWVRDAGFRKELHFADAGTSRQHSIYRGLQRMKALGTAEEDIVIVHDAVRPCVGDGIWKESIKALEDDEVDGVMPVIPVKDTVYQSRDGRIVTGLLNRDEIYAGQAPESFRFGKYYAAHQGKTESDFASIRGSSQIAIDNGMNIKLIRGSEDNYKISTPQDLELFRYQTEHDKW